MIRPTEISVQIFREGVPIQLYIRLGGEHMASARDSSDKPFTLWVDPFTNHIVVEAEEFMLKFRKLEHIREYIYLLLNETNKLEYHLTKSYEVHEKAEK